MANLNAIFLNFVELFAAVTADASVVVDVVVIIINIIYVYIKFFFIYSFIGL